jgi:nucleoside-diphosphate-sugar epimerase
MNILLTGSTGFIGQRIVRKLASQGDQLFLLVRPSSKDKAQKIFKDTPNLTFVEGDIEDTDVVKNIFTISKLIDEIECVVHLAAHYDLTSSLKDAYIRNVVGTQNMIYLTSKMQSLKAFHYFSTYAVNPIRQGAVNEDFLIKDHLPFHDEYSKTKNHAEHLVRKLKRPGVQTIIYRPGVIIGDSKTGEMDKIDGPYYFYDFVQTLLKLKDLSSKLPFLPMPIRKNSYLPLLPVDTLTDWCSHIILHPPKADLRCYHMVSEDLIRTKDFLEESMDLMGLSLKILPVKFTRLLAPLLPIMNIPKEAAFYMNQETIFDRSHLSTDYPELKAPSYRQYLPHIIEGYLGRKP